MTKDKGGPAFPIASEWNPAGDFCGGGYLGMEVRDYFAAKAMAAYINRDMLLPCMTESDIDLEFINTAAFAYRMAEAMLKEREKCC